MMNRLVNKPGHHQLQNKNKHFKIKKERLLISNRSFFIYSNLVKVEIKTNV